MSPRTLAFLLALGAAACQGEGSDIGPGLGAKPPDPLQVTVLDDGGRAVTGAAVMVGPARAVTGTVGRAEFPALVNGAVDAVVDAGAASALAGDALGGVTIRAAAADGGRMLDRVAFLPDFAPSAGLTVATGTPVGPLSLDDSASSGAVLDLAAGTIATDGAAVSARLRTAALQARHVPLDLPRAGGAATLVARVVAFEPEGLLLAPGATLSVPNDIGSADGADVDVWRYRAETGGWIRLGAATLVAGRLRADALADRGGLYAFTASVGATVELSGRVVGPDQAAVARAFVCAAGHAVLSDDDGRFRIGPLAAVDLAGAARTETVELVGGRGYLPRSARHDVAMAAGSRDLGDLVLDADRSGHVRILTVERGRVSANLRVRIGDDLSRAARDVFVDASGVAFLEDVPEGFYSVRAGRPYDVVQSWQAEGIIRLLAAQRLGDLRVFSVLRPWDQNIRGNVVEVFGDSSGALLRDAVLARGLEPGRGFLGRTLESGVFFTSISPGDHLTATLATAAAGRRVVAASTIVGTSAHRLQMPIAHVTQPDVGFDRHGLIDGAIAGGTAGRTRALRTSLPLPYGDWFERVVLGETRGGGRVPVKQDVDGAGGTASFRVGVPLPRGHLAVVEGDAAGGVFALERAFVQRDLVPDEGRVQALAGTFVAADRTFTARGLLAGLDPRIAAATLTADWGQGGPDGTVADAARGIGGASVVAAGVDLALRLPPLAGGRHHVCVVGRGSAGGIDVEQRAVLEFGAEGDLAARALLPVPTFTAPAPGAVVAAGGFAIAVAIPDGGTYLVFTLSSDDGTELRRWDVYAYHTVTSFTFQTLVPEQAEVLVPGRTWRLTVAAHRIGRGPVAQQAAAFNSVIANLGSVRLGELGVDAISSATITITTQ